MSGLFAVRIRVDSLEIAVEEVGDDVEHGFLDPVFAAVCGAGDEVALARDAFLLQGLIEQVGLARGDDGVGGAVHQEHRGARLADVVDGVGCLLVGEDATVTAAEDRRALTQRASVAPAERCFAWTSSE